MTPLRLGARRSIDGRTDLGPFKLDADNLTTHGVVVGMTGSGKTGLVTVLIEEALASDIPVLVVDVKGDLPNLLLAVPSFEPEALAPWVEAAKGDEDGIADPDYASRCGRRRPLRGRGFQRMGRAQSWVLPGDTVRGRRLRPCGLP